MGKMHDRQQNLLKFRQFATTCLVGTILGGILCGAGTLLHRHSYSKQSFWRGDRIELSGSSASASASDYIKADFTPQDDYKRVLNLCVGISHATYETFKKTPVPQIEWQALLGDQPVSDRYTVTNQSWSWSSQYGACARLGSFSVLADRQYQIQLKSPQINQRSFPSAPYLNVKPDVMEMKGFMTNYQLGGALLQTVGVSVFAIAVVKGLIKLLKPASSRV
jgi:hypothetical protein